MCPRITEDVQRPAPVTIRVNGNAVSAFEGESLATALMAAGVLIMSRDSKGRSRSPYCNMGVCFDCLVTVREGAAPDGGARRVRACLAAVRPDIHVTVPAQ